jgi:hypothetical protein
VKFLKQTQKRFAGFAKPLLGSRDDALQFHGELLKMDGRNMGRTAKHLVAFQRRSGRRAGPTLRSARVKSESLPDFDTSTDE